MVIIKVEELIKDIDKFLLIDVRSPSEFKQAHIPGAINIPLLSDEERKEVGILYKHSSKRKAIKRGLDFFGPKMRNIVETIDQITASEQLNEIPTKSLALYCWRGGMRSKTMAWLLSTYGYQVFILDKGYKSYRHWCLEQFEHSFKYILIGGYTGTGKTKLLSDLGFKKNLPFIDLEKLANHKGSAFGGIGMGDQPTQETFENNLAYRLHEIRRKYEYVLVEDESQRIGSVSIPQMVWETMKCGTMVFLDVDYNKRLKNILTDYGSLDRSLLGGAIVRLQKKMGGLETRTCLEFLLNKDLESCFGILLKYYDKLYYKSLGNKKEGLENYYEISLTGSEQDNLQKIYNTIRNIEWISN